MTDGTCIAIDTPRTLSGVKTAVGLREMKKERTRADIVRVATRMFARRGFDDVTVEEIAAEAEVSHRTFYRYFATKEELVLGPLQLKLDNLAESLAARPHDEPVVASVRSAILDMANCYEHDLDDGRDLIALVRATPSLRQRQNERHAAYEQVMVPLIAARLGVDPTLDMRPALVAGCAMAAIRTATEQWLVGPPKQPLMPIVEDALAMVTLAFADLH
ncbi:MAG: transcriptional regulator, TetR family [Ilumatobacteraceae bacterium]|nr:transcriptional regulator, TetR family [Ilumatobacteraceae bacterium]